MPIGSALAPLKFELNHWAGSGSFWKRGAEGGRGKGLKPPQSEDKATTCRDVDVSRHLPGAHLQMKAAGRPKGSPQPWWGQIAWRGICPAILMPGDPAGISFVPRNHSGFVLPEGSPALWPRPVGTGAQTPEQHIPSAGAPRPPLCIPSRPQPVFSLNGLLSEFGKGVHFYPGFGRLIVCFKNMHKPMESIVSTLGNAGSAISPFPQRKGPRPPVSCDLTDRTPVVADPGPEPGVMSRLQLVAFKTWGESAMRRCDVEHGRDETDQLPP